MSLLLNDLSAAEQGASPSNAVACGCAAVLSRMNMYCFIIRPEGVAEQANLYTLLR